MEEMELTQEQRGLLIERITELMDESVLKFSDWCAIYDLMLAACEREKAITMENYLLSCLESE